MDSTPVTRISQKFIVDATRRAHSCLTLNPKGSSTGSVLGVFPNDH